LLINDKTFKLAESKDILTRISLLLNHPIK
jgi:hypothetical protein